MRRMCEKGWWFVGLGLLLVAGCRLNEPDAIPAIVTSYRVHALTESANDIPVVLEMDKCPVEVEMIGPSERESPVLGGVISALQPMPTLPVRGPLEREFRKMLASNFRTTLPDEQPQLRICVNVVDFSVCADWTETRAELSAVVLALSVKDGEVLFEKSYHISASTRENYGSNIPACVYECHQRLVRRFAEDLPAGEKFANWLFTFN